MRWMDPWYSAFMLDAALDASRAGKANYQTDYRWEDLEQISPHAAVAVIAAEDQFFPFHTRLRLQVDPRGHPLQREAVHAQTSARARRQHHLAAGGQEPVPVVGRGYVRKGLEAYFTLLIEVTWPKERILEVYLNIAQFGDGIYGVEAASQRFYRMPAAKLGRYEAATLAAVLPNPITFKVNAPVGVCDEAARLDPGDRCAGWAARATSRNWKTPPSRRRRAHARSSKASAELPAQSWKAKRYWPFGSMNTGGASPAVTST